MLQFCTVQPLHYFGFDFDSCPYLPGTLNSQLAGRQREVRSSVSADLIRRIFTLAFRHHHALGACLWSAIERDPHTDMDRLYMLTFMAPIFAYGRIMGASWNMLLINKWRTTRGRKTPSTRIRMDSLGVCSLSSLVLFS